MVFTVQVMLMLVLGHIIALSQPISKAIQFIIRDCKTGAALTLRVTIATMLMGFFNWGLGLVFGALMARSAGIFATEKRIPFNYAVLCAAGYTGMLCWHGGITGSAPIKAAEPGHQLEAMIGIVPQIETLLSSLNLVTSILLLTIIPAFLYFLAKKVSPQAMEKSDYQPKLNLALPQLIGAEKIDHWSWFSKIIGVVFIVVSFSKASQSSGFAFLTPDFINFALIGLVLILHKNIVSLSAALNEAISGVSGILLQFPLYFGIMGIMLQSGLTAQLASFFAENSSATSLPIYTFLSAGIINFFIPSGGAQWVLQGPVACQAALEAGVSIPQIIMSIAYGDQLTNMMQPFWALPLLGITGIKAKDVLPYTFLIMLVGAAIFVTTLLLF
jgi:short-chain fatty acids transporter